MDVETVERLVRTAIRDRIVGQPTLNDGRWTVIYEHVQGKPPLDKLQVVILDREVTGLADEEEIIRDIRQQVGLGKFIEKYD